MQKDDRVKVVFAESDEPSGLASMLAQYFEQNIRDFQRKSDQAVGIKGKLAVEAIEGDVAVTINFKGEEIEIRDGGDTGADMFVRGGIFSINELAMGAPGAFKKILGGELKIRSAWKHPLFALRVARFMSMPAELKTNGGSLAAIPLRWKLVIGAGGAVALGAAMYLLAK
jgi:hypothetical protein